jgi:hypothetical protein
MDKTGYGSIAAAGPFFFFSAWLLMLFAGIVGDEISVAAFGYMDAMKVTIALWLVVAPLVGAIGAARSSS